MKYIYIAVAVLAIIFIAIQLFAMSTQKDIETYPYSVLKKYDTFEIREYEPSLFTSVTIPSNEYKEASNSGFSVLAGYIFGGNETNEKIAMTSPVSMSLEDSMTMMFMVPKKFDKDKLPKPNSKEIEFVEEPARTVAAVSFGGWANNEKIEKYKNKLIEYLNAEGIPHDNRFYFLGYNAPYEVTNRKNEVIVELKKGWDITIN